MSRHGDERDSMAKLVQAFQDAHIETAYNRGIACRGIPYIPDETAQSHCFRFIDYMNPLIWDDVSTRAISKEVILALLQCAARLYEGGVHAREAMDLIESEDTRAILSLGIQDSLAQIIHQRCLESITQSKSEATNAENCSRHAGLISAIRKNEARQLNQQAMVIEHISSLCHAHCKTLQNTFDSPKLDEHFMFSNYVTLSKTLSLYEKSWLIILFPDIFQWNTSSNGLVSPPSEDPVIISDELQSHITSGMYRDIQEAFRFVDSSTPPLTINDQDVLHWLEKSTPQESNEMWSICCNWRNQHQHSDSESYMPLNEVKNVWEWIELLREKALTHRNFASVEAVTSVLDRANRLNDHTKRRERDTTSLSKSFEKEGSFICDSIMQPGTPSSSDGVSELDLNVLGSDDDSECIFPLSPCTHNDNSNNKSMSTFPMYDTNMPEEGLGGCLNSAEDIKSAFTITDLSNNSLKMAGNDFQHWSKKYLRRSRSTNREKERRLKTIHEESQEQ